MRCLENLGSHFELKPPGKKQNKNTRLLELGSSPLHHHSFQASFKTTHCFQSTLQPPQTKGPNRAAPIKPGHAACDSHAPGALRSWCRLGLTAHPNDPSHKLPPCPWLKSCLRGWVCLCLRLFVCLFVCLFMFCLFARLPVYLSVCRFVGMFACLLVRLLD